MLASLQIKAATWLAEKGGKLLVWGLLAAIVAGTYALTYRAGIQHCEKKQVAAQIKAAEQHATAIAKDATARAPVVEAAATRREQLNNTNKQAQEKLHEAVKSSGPKPSCDLTDDELRALNEIGS